MKAARLKLATALTSISLVALPVPLVAQQTTTSSATAPAPLAKAVCLSRKSDGPGKNDMVIAVPPAQQADMEGRGYVARACKSDSGATAAYRSKVCELAQKAPKPLRDQFIRNSKVSPQELCDMAGKVSD